jgi:hypothetical protein
VRGFLLFGLLVSALSVFTSCEQNINCDQEKQSHFNIGFYTHKNGEVKDSLIDNFTLNGIDRPDSLPDSILYNAVNNINRILLPPAPNQDYCDFVLFFDSIPEIHTINTVVPPVDTVIYIAIYDTISLRYTRKLRLISPECGFTNDYKLEQITTSHNAIDSASIIKQEITSGYEENIKIFF